MQLTRKINAIDKTKEYVRWLPRRTVKQKHFPKPKKYIRFEPRNTDVQI